MRNRGKKEKKLFIKEKSHFYTIIAQQNIIISGTILHNVSLRDISSGIMRYPSLLNDSRFNGIANPTMNLKLLLKKYAIVKNGIHQIREYMNISAIWNTEMLIILNVRINMLKAIPANKNKTKKKNEKSKSLVENPIFLQICVRIIISDVPIISGCLIGVSKGSQNKNILRNFAKIPLSSFFC